MLKCLDDYITPVNNPEDENTAWHLFVVKIKFNILKKDKDYFIKELKKKIFKHKFTIFQYIFILFFSKYKSENLKATEAYYDEILSLPLHPQMNNKDVEFVVESIKEVLKICYNLICLRFCMKVGVLGLGSIGLRHASNLKKLDYEFFGYDIDKKKSKKIDALGGIFFSNKQELIDIIDVGIIATPNHCHLDDLKLLTKN